MKEKNLYMEAALSLTSGREVSNVVKEAGSWGMTIAVSLYMAKIQWGKKVFISF